MRRRHLLVGIVAAVTVPRRFAAAAASADFEPRAFHAAQEAGRSIVVQVHASW